MSNLNGVSLGVYHHYGQNRPDTDAITVYAVGDGRSCNDGKVKTKKNLYYLLQWQKAANV